MCYMAGLSLRHLENVPARFYASTATPGCSLDPAREVPAQSEQSSVGPYYNKQIVEGSRLSHRSLTLTQDERRALATATPPAAATVPGRSSVHRHRSAFRVCRESASAGRQHVRRPLPQRQRPPVAEELLRFPHRDRLRVQEGVVTKATFACTLSPAWTSHRRLSRSAVRCPETTAQNPHENGAAYMQNPFTDQKLLSRAHPTEVGCTYAALAVAAFSVHTPVT